MGGDARVTDRTILWRRLDLPGLECARLSARTSAWQLTGTAVFAHDRRPCRLDYGVVCDAAWRTASVRVTGWVGPQPVSVDIVVDPPGVWRLDGATCDAVAGCVDVDLSFSPATNVLPIRRLDLPVGRFADVRAAWLRFPQFTLEPLNQRYHRIRPLTYRYESGGGAFATDLQVNAAGFVTEYPGLWETEGIA